MLKWMFDWSGGVTPVFILVMVAGGASILVQML